jgi:hypothetical protein
MAAWGVAKCGPVCAGGTGLLVGLGVGLGPTLGTGVGLAAGLDDAGAATVVTDSV